MESCLYLHGNCCSLVYALSCCSDVWANVCEDWRSTFCFYVVDNRLLPVLGGLIGESGIFPAKNFAH